MVDDCNTTIMEVFEQTKDVPLSLANPIRIPPRSVMVALVECFLREYPNIHVSRTYVNDLPESSNCMPFSFTNLSMHSQYLGKDKVVGFAESTTDEVEVHELADYNEIKEMMRDQGTTFPVKPKQNTNYPQYPLIMHFLHLLQIYQGLEKWTCRILTSSQRQGQLLMNYVKDTQQYSPKVTRILAGHSSLPWT